MKETIGYVGKTALKHFLDVILLKFGSGNARYS